MVESIKFVPHILFSFHIWYLINLQINVNWNQIPFAYAKFYFNTKQKI